MSSAGVNHLLLVNAQWDTLVKKYLELEIVFVNALEESTADAGAFPGQKSPSSKSVSNLRRKITFLVVCPFLEMTSSKSFI